MTFIGNYWWAILAIAGAIIYTWRVVRRASRSANLGATEGADNQDTARAPALRLYLVVLAAEWGHGRRQGWLSNLHLGARDPAAKDPSDSFVMVGKTFKGLTDELLTWQTEQLLAREVARKGITVEVVPELVVEVAIDGVQVSPRYSGGVTLRFARVRRYRPDKAAADADTIDAVRALLPR